MNQKTLLKLEYDKIINLLAGIFGQREKTLQDFVAYD